MHEGRGTSKGIGVGIELGKSEIGKSKVVWGKGEGGRLELDKAGVGSEWLGESRIKVVIGSTGWEMQGKESLEISKEGKIWGKVMVEWGEEEYVEGKDSLM